MLAYSCYLVTKSEMLCFLHYFTWFLELCSNVSVLILDSFKQTWCFEGFGQICNIQNKFFNIWKFNMFLYSIWAHISVLLLYTHTHTHTSILIYFTVKNLLCLKFFDHFISVIKICIIIEILMCFIFYDLTCLMFKI